MRKPLSPLTKGKELKWKRHLNVETDIGVALYYNTNFLFRLPERLRVVFVPGSAFYTRHGIASSFIMEPQVDNHANPLNLFKGRHKPDDIIRRRLEHFLAPGLCRLFRMIRANPSIFRIPLNIPGHRNFNAFKGNL